MLTEGLLLESAESRQIRVDSFEFALFLLYFSLDLFIASQLIRIAYFRHKLHSFQVGFLLLLFFWALLRAVFFLFEDFLEDINWLYLLIYWTPINIQFSTFSLLIVYYAHLHQQQMKEWKEFKRKYVIVWILTNALFLVLAFVWILLGIIYDGENVSEPDWLSRIHGVFTGTIFFVLVVILARYGWRATRPMNQLISSGRPSKFPGKTPITRILLVSFSLFALFTTRCLYDFIMATGQVNFNVSDDNNFEVVFVFVAFCLWEIIPSILVLVLFGKVKATSLGAFSKKGNLEKKSSFSPVITNSSAEIASETPLLSGMQQLIAANEITPFIEGYPVSLNYGSQAVSDIDHTSGP